MTRMKQYFLKSSSSAGIAKNVADETDSFCRGTNTENEREDWPDSQHLDDGKKCPGERNL